jgi:hypothetical protein
VGRGGGTRSRCFNSGYHDPELLELGVMVPTIETTRSRLYVDHLQVEILTYRSVIQDVWGICVGGGLGVRDLVVSVVGYRDPELLQANFL